MKAKQIVALKRDAYGINARASCVADYCELVVLRHTPLALEDLKDALRDASLVIPPEKFQGAADVIAVSAVDEESDEDPGEDDCDSSGDRDQRYTDSARRVFQLLRQRKAVLGDRYPFALSDEDRIVRKKKIARAHEPYLSLLALTVAHGHRLKAEEDPKQVFEDTVARVLQTRGWKCANVGRVRRSAKGRNAFESTLGQVCALCGLEASVQNAIISNRAGDEKVDTVAHLPWHDNRTGRWSLIGQVTLEKSDGWQAKLDEPKPDLWRDLLTTGIRPLAFLAVPHHVEPAHLKKLVRDSDRVVLDRLRFARFDTRISPAERVLLETVLACDVEYR